jgi:erythronate-4-phosphate dehydrogenase
VDALIVRSVTRVSEPLLAGSSVKFVGTATIGCDHVDLEYLRSRGIAFASAPGSNATSVAEYVVAALLRSAAARRRSLEGSTLAVIGVGNVGARVAQKAEAIGMRCALNDPPRQRVSRDVTFVALDEAVAGAEYVTLHVPLESTGPDRTVGMAGRAFFDGMRAGAVFLNTSRGPVVDETALAAALESGHLSHAVLDVWQREPDIDAHLVERVFLATPHIAGYSFDGKVRATIMIVQALGQWLQRPEDLDLSSVMPPFGRRVDLSEAPSYGSDDEDLLRIAVSSAYDIAEDDRALRRAMTMAAPGAEFDLLRKNYRQRREFHHTTIVLPKRKEALIGKVRRLGFGVETP